MAGGVNGCRHEVYPRPRGGTRQPPFALFGRLGLSPPTRGNLRIAISLALRMGSIPAHAGEPAA